MMMAVIFGWTTKRVPSGPGSLIDVVLDIVTWRVSTGAMSLTVIDACGFRGLIKRGHGLVTEMGSDRDWVHPSIHDRG